MRSTAITLGLIACISCTSGDGGRDNPRALRLSAEPDLVKARGAIPLLSWALTLGVQLASCGQLMVAQQAPDIGLGPVEPLLGAEFSAITSVRELSDGRLLIADRLEMRLAVRDPLTSVVTTVGREGDGPGEYRGIGRLVPLGGDSSVLTDRNTHRWLVLDGVDAVGALAPRLLPNRLLGSLLAGGDRFSRVLGTHGFGYTMGIPRMRENADSLLVLLIDLASQAVDTVARVGGRGHDGFVRIRPPRGSGGPVWFFPSNPLAAEEQALLFHDGWIAIARTDPYRVDWRTSDGRWIRGAPLPFDTIWVDHREKCAAVARRAPTFVERHGCDPSQLPAWPEILPAFLPGLVPALFAAPDRRLIVARTRSAASPRHRYDVVDRRGRLAGTFLLDDNEELIGVGVTSVYTVVTDSLGLQSLRRYRWP